MEERNTQITGIVSEIQRYSVHDGPGIRTIVFLKGCPLRCKWCSNPENQNFGQELMWQHDDKQRLVGEPMTVRQVRDVIERDRPYYQRSGGGMTFSGGEALSQPDFVAALSQACHEWRITTGIETTGYASAETIYKVMPEIDYVLFDVKHIDEQKHIKFTGVSNIPILENLRKTVEMGKNVTARVPVIPSFNDTEEEIAEIAAFVASLKGIRELDLLPYHRLGTTKYRWLDRKYELPDLLPPTDAHMQKLLAVVNKAGLRGQIGG